MRCVYISCTFAQLNLMTFLIDAAPLTSPSIKALSIAAMLSNASLLLFHDFQQQQRNRCASLDLSWPVLENERN